MMVQSAPAAAAVAGVSKAAQEKAAARAGDQVRSLSQRMFKHSTSSRRLAAHGLEPSYIDGKIMKFIVCVWLIIMTANALSS